MVVLVFFFMGSVGKKKKTEKTPSSSSFVSHLQTRGLCLLCALVKVGHRLSVEVNPGVVVRIRGLLRCRTSCLA